MASYSYNRKYELIISESFQDFVPILQDNLPPIDYVVGIRGQPEYTAVQPLDLRVVDKQRDRIFSELQIKATISESNTASGSKGAACTIYVYNLNKENREVVVKAGNRVLLKAGYGEDESLPIIFAGTVEDGYTRKEGVDMVTVLHCNAVARPAKVVRASFHVEKGGTYADVFKKCAEYFYKSGVVEGKIILDNDMAPKWFAPLQLIPSQTPLGKKGYTFRGKVSKCLDDLCKMFGYAWKIHNNALYIHPRYVGDVYSEYTLDNSNIISMEKMDSSSGISGSGSKARGYTIKTLLDGRLNKEISLVVSGMGDRDGKYKVTSFEHHLDYEGQDWYTTLEVSE